MGHPCHLVYVTVGRFMCSYVRTSSTHSCTTLWLSLITECALYCTILWLSLSIAGWPYFYMVIWWVMFCEVIPHILSSWFPVYKTLFCLPLPSSNKISYLLTWIFFSDSSINITFINKVLCFDWVWYLGKTAFVESNT